MSRQLQTLLFSLAGLAVASVAGAATWTAQAHYGLAGVNATVVTAPEIGPQAAAGALTLLSGVLLMLRGRRSKS